MDEQTLINARPAVIFPKDSDLPYQGELLAFGSFGVQQEEKNHPISLNEVGAGSGSPLSCRKAQEVLTYKGQSYTLLEILNLCIHSNEDKRIFGETLDALLYAQEGEARPIIQFGTLAPVEQVSLFVSPFEGGQAALAELKRAILNEAQKLYNKEHRVKKSKKKISKPHPLPKNYVRDNIWKILEAVKKDKTSYDGQSFVYTMGQVHLMFSLECDWPALRETLRLGLEKAEAAEKETLETKCKQILANFYELGEYHHIVQYVQQVLIPNDRGLAVECMSLMLTKIYQGDPKHPAAQLFATFLNTFLPYDVPTLESSGIEIDASNVNNEESFIMLLSAYRSLWRHFFAQGRVAYAVEVLAYLCKNVKSKENVVNFLRESEVKCLVGEVFGSQGLDTASKLSVLQRLVNVKTIKGNEHWLQSYLNPMGIKRIQREDLALKSVAKPEDLALKSVNAPSVEPPKKSPKVTGIAKAEIVHKIKFDNYEMLKASMGIAGQRGSYHVNDKELEKFSETISLQEAPFFWMQLYSKACIQQRYIYVSANIFKSWLDAVGASVSAINKGEITAYTITDMMGHFKDVLSLLSDEERLNAINYVKNIWIVGHGNAELDKQYPVPEDPREAFPYLYARMLFCAHLYEYIIHNNLSASDPRYQPMQELAYAQMLKIVEKSGALFVESQFSSIFGPFNIGINECLHSILKEQSDESLEGLKKVTEFIKLNQGRLYYCLLSFLNNYLCNLLKTEAFDESPKERIVLVQQALKDILFQKAIPVPVEASSLRGFIYESQLFITVLTSLSKSFICLESSSIIEDGTLDKCFELITNVYKAYSSFDYDEEHIKVNEVIYNLFHHMLRDAIKDVSVFLDVIAPRYFEVSPPGAIVFLNNLLLDSLDKKDAQADIASIAEAIIAFLAEGSKADMVKSPLLASLLAYRALPLLRQDLLQEAPGMRILGILQKYIARDDQTLTDKKTLMLNWVDAIAGVYKQSPQVAGSNQLSILVSYVFEQAQTLTAQEAEALQLPEQGLVENQANIAFNLHYYNLDKARDFFLNVLMQKSAYTALLVMQQSIADASKCKHLSKEHIDRLLAIHEEMIEAYTKTENFQEAMLQPILLNESFVEHTLASIDLNYTLLFVEKYFLSKASIVGVKLGVHILTEVIKERLTTTMRPDFAQVECLIKACVQAVNKASLAVIDPVRIRLAGFLGACALRIHHLYQTPEAKKLAGFAATFADNAHVRSGLWLPLAVIDAQEEAL